MPDMQSELLKALEDGKRRFLSATISEWDTHEQNIRKPQPQQEKVMTFKTTGNATRDIFAMVQQNQHKHTPKDMLDVMAQHGHVPQTVSSLITQMKRVGLIAEDDSRHLYTTYNEFISLHKLAKTLPKIKTKPKHAKPKKAGLTALVPDTMTVSTSNTITPQPATVWTADNVLKNIGVAEAAKLYAELGKLFGGK